MSGWSDIHVIISSSGSFVLCRLTCVKWIDDGVFGAVKGQTSGDRWVNCFIAVFVSFEYFLLYFLIEFILIISLGWQVPFDIICKYIVLFVKIIHFVSFKQRYTNSIAKVTPHVRLPRLSLFCLRIRDHPSCQNVFQHLIPRIHSCIMISLLATFSLFAIFHVILRRDDSVSPIVITRGKSVKEWGTGETE